MAMHENVKIALLPTGFGAVIIEGHDISASVRCVDIHAQPGQLTEVRLTLVAGHGSELVSDKAEVMTEE